MSRGLHYDKGRILYIGTEDDLQWRRMSNPCSKGKFIRTVHTRSLIIYDNNNYT